MRVPDIRADECNDLNLDDSMYSERWIMRSDIMCDHITDSARDAFATIHFGEAKKLENADSNEALFNQIDWTKFAPMKRGAILIDHLSSYINDTEQQTGENDNG